MIRRNRDRRIAIEAANDGSPPRAGVSRHAIATLLVVGALLWAATPVVGLTWITAQNGDAAFVPSKPAWVPIAPAPIESSRASDLGLSWQDPDKLIAPAWAGTIQAVSIDEGSVVTSGTPIARLDGVVRLAWNTQGVLYRPLARGDTGEDVGWVKSLLAARGFPQSTSFKVDRQAIAGIRGFAKSIGVPDFATIATFDPAWIVYLPRESVVLSAVSIEPAEIAPSAGTEIAVGSAVLSGASLLESGTISTEQAPDAPLQGTGELELLKRDHGLIVQPGEVLQYGATLLAVDDTTQSLTADSLTELSATAPTGSNGIIVQLVRPSQPNWFAVPPGALSIGAEVSLCVSRGKETLTLPVLVIASQAEGTVVEGELSDGDSVRVPAISAAAPCQ